MSASYYFVLTRPKPGQDAAFNDWYSKRHIFDLVAIPGISAAQRFQLIDATTGAATPDYLAIYEFADTEQAIQGIAERRGTDKMPSTDAIDRDASRGVVFRPNWSVEPNFRFGEGLLELLKLDDPSKADALEAATGRLVANARQSRPGPPVFDVATFSAVAEGVSESLLAAASTSTMRVRLQPITERVSAAE